MNENRFQPKLQLQRQRLSENKPIHFSLVLTRLTCCCNFSPIPFPQSQSFPHKRFLLRTLFPLRIATICVCTCASNCVRVLFCFASLSHPFIAFSHCSVAVCVQCVVRRSGLFVTCSSRLQPCHS